MEKKLYKSRKDKMISGVCGGLAEYFNIDSSIIRLVFVLLTFATNGVLFIIYILMSALIPYEPLYRPDGTYYYSTQESGYTTHSKDNYSSQSTYEKNYSEKINSVGKYNIGLFLIVLGLAIFLGNIIPGFYRQYFIPVLCLIIGISLIVSSLAAKRDGKSTGYNNPNDYNYTHANEKNASADDTHEDNDDDMNEEIIIDIEEEVIVPEDEVEEKVENGEGI